VSTAIYSSFSVSSFVSSRLPQLWADRSIFLLTIATFLVARFFSDNITCKKPIGYSTMSADLCLPTDGGQYSTALRCSSAGVGE